MSQPLFKEYRPNMLRLWHWANFFTISGLLLTVLLRKTVLSFRDNAVILQGKLSEMGVTLTEEQARSITKVFRDNMWEWHLNLGLILAGLLVFRFVAEFFTSSEHRLLTRLRMALGFLKAPKVDRNEVRHLVLVKLGYVVFYIVLVLMVLTGLVLMYPDALQFSKDVMGVFKEVHELMMWFFVVFIVGHLLGVTLMELTKAPGLVSDMFNGGSKK